MGATLPLRRPLIARLPRNSPAQSPRSLWEGSGATRPRHLMLFPAGGRTAEKSETPPSTSASLSINHSGKMAGWQSQRDERVFHLPSFTGLPLWSKSHRLNVFVPCSWYCIAVNFLFTRQVWGKIFHKLLRMNFGRKNMYGQEHLYLLWLKKTRKD